MNRWVKLKKKIIYKKKLVSFFMRLENTGATYNLNLQYRMNRWVKLNIGEFLYEFRSNTGATYNLNLQYRMNRWVKLNIGEFLYEIREYWSYI